MLVTRTGLEATGLGFVPSRPSLGRLVHLRAVLAARLALEASDAAQAGQRGGVRDAASRAAMGGRIPQVPMIMDGGVIRPPWGG